MVDTPVNGDFISGLEDVKSVGRYEIIQKIGQGGTAVVFQGRDPYIRRYVAIKLSQPSDRYRESFFLEVQSAGRFNHPNIVSIYDAGVYNDYCYITMEYVEGPTLEKFCDKDNLLPVNRVIEILLSVCNGLDYAHKEGVIHRDIKPSNIMVTKEGNIKITDFGIAQLTGHTAPTGVFGTPSYMSPEQLKEEMAGLEGDIFSLGCVLYELLTGKQAFSGHNYFSIMYKITNEEPPTVRELRPELPAILEEITAKAMKKDFKERYQTCMDLAYELRVALRGIVETKSDEKLKDIVDYIRKVPFFHNFSKEQVNELVAASDIVRVIKGKVIVAHGEINDSFYIILSGRANVRKDGRDIAQIGVGECFGEMAFLGGQPRVASVAADTDCVLIKISATLLDRSPESIQLLFYKNFGMTLVRRLSQPKKKN
ncbi:protein kinase [Thermodesulfobacteriota bacterium]